MDYVATEDEKDVGLTGSLQPRRIRGDRWPQANAWSLRDGDLIHAVFQRRRWDGWWRVKLLKWMPHAPSVVMDSSPWRRTRTATARWLSQRTTAP